MKQTIVVLCQIFLGALTLVAQGNFEFNNSGPYYVTVQDSEGVINNGTAVRIGTTATSVGFPATCGPGQITFELFMAANGTEPTLSDLLGTAIAGNGLPAGVLSSANLVGTTVNASSGLGVLQGTFSSSPAPFVISANVGTTVEWAIYAFTTIDSATYSALTPLESNYALTSGNNIPAATFGTGAGQVSGMNLVPVPEPTTFVLGGLGAVVLMFFCRRRH